MPDYASLRPFTTATPDMDTFNVSALNRLASRDYFSVVWVCSCEIRDPLHVVGNGMVRVEPRSTWCSAGWYSMLAPCSHDAAL